MKIEIKKAELRDAKNLAVLKQQVWISTYGIAGIREEYSDYVLSHFSIDNIEHAIKDENRHVILAEIDGHLVAAADLSLSPRSPRPEVKEGLEINILYVLDRFQGLGIGIKMLNECLKTAKEHKAEAIWFTLHYENNKAIDFYSKNGFNIVGDTLYNFGGEKYKNFIMHKEL